MVNTELYYVGSFDTDNYNILNIVVNTEPCRSKYRLSWHYNILNIVVNTERETGNGAPAGNYNILNIVVNTEH